tara:strand:- start:1751 stop:1930 length:180 start_codon:yes stop_codon:yes gene_type:complete
MFLEELATTILGMIIALPVAYLLLDWFLGQLQDMMAMTMGDWLAIGIFFAVAVIITIVA